MKLNEKQALAANTIDKNVLLDASAGTGKTTVLVNRYVNILDKGNFDGIKNEDVLSSVVAITFTKKASNELKERISKLIYEKAKTDERFKAYYNNMPFASISTVHQFALKMLKSLPLLAKIDPRAKVAEEDEAKLLLDRAIREALEEKNYDDFFKALGKNYDDDFVSSLNAIANKTMGMDIAKLCDNTKTFFKEINNEEKINEALNTMLNTIDEVKGSLTERATLFKMINKHEAALNNLKNNGLSDSDINLIKIFAYEIGQNKNKQDEYDSITNSAIYILSALEISKLDYYDEFFNLLESIHEKYKSIKKEEAVLDFNDLEILFRDLLKQKELREFIKSKISYIMVDEFQDTSPIQKEIYYLLNEILGKKRLFVVGDFKQSIYAFRGADVSLYNSVREDFEKDDKNSTCILMNDNYRTGKEIISSVNKLFNAKMPGYVDLEAKGDIVNSEVKIINYIKDRERDDEARAIANEIIDLHEKGEAFKDIVILVRNNNSSEAIEKMLKSVNIPVYNNASISLNSRDEIEDIYNFIHYLRYEDELSLIALLRSSVYALDDDEIFTIKDRDEFKNYKEELNIYISMKDDERLDEVIKTFIKNTNYTEKILHRNRAPQAYANIRSFINKISSYYDSGITNFENIADALLASRNRSASEASYISENDDLVRIMTIHKAKGLEAKVVICASTNFRKNFDKGFAKLSGDKIFLRFKDLYANFKSSQEEDNLLEEEEKKRNLYVMLTRAKEKLIIFKSSGSAGFTLLLEGMDGKSEDANLEERTLEAKKLDIEESMDDLITKEKLQWQSLYAPLPSRAAYAYDFNANSFKVYDDERDILEEGSDRKSLGSASHRFCEAYEGENFDEILNESAESYKLSEKEKELLSICAKNYEKFYKTVTNAKTYKEFEYYYIKDDIIYTGVIDRLDEYEDHVEIIDYKVTSLDEDTVKNIYKTQMKMYVDAVKNIFKKEAKAKIFILSRDKLIDME